MIRRALLLILALIAAFAAYVQFRPNTFRMERTTTINAPADKVFAKIADFKQWQAWSPFDKYDTDLKRTFGGAASGKGATYGWQGTNTGEGTMLITEATAPTKIAIDLHFIKPFEGRNVAEFIMTPKGAATEVAWVMSGNADFMTRAMLVFTSMDDMMGKDFSDGLANLKALVESGK